MKTPQESVLASDTADTPAINAVKPTTRRGLQKRGPLTPQRLARIGVAIGVPAAVLVWWEWKSRSTPPLQLPAPRVVVERTVDLLVGPESSHTWTSMIRIVIAVGLALVIGTALVFMARLLPVTETLVDKVILSFLNSVPALGWAILGVVWFGISDSAVIFVVTLILVPFCMVNMWEGMRGLDPGIQEMGRSFTRSKWMMLVRIQLPLLMPYVFAAVRLSFSVGWKVALIAEFFGAQSGLGLVMNRARQSFDTPTVFATIVVVLIIVTLTERLLLDPLSRMFARRTGTVVTGA